MVLNYKEIDFKAGIEIHQQLDTSKLFCSCNSILTEKIDAKIKRELRATASELGEKDLVAKFEMGKSRYAVYEYSKDSNCLVELDEEPIHNINPKALEIALIVSKLLNCKIVDAIQVMRKQVLDYSNTSGFQRTMIISFNGYIETSKGKVSIQTVCLEEDAARKIKEENDYIVYRLDRLGIPLIEIATGPDIKDPEHAKETAEKLGMILRSVNGIKRGLGTIRQDVNVSIKGHPRIEIKGFQDLRSIPKIAEYEVNRQLKIIEIHNKLKNIKNYNSEFLELTNVFTNTGCKLIKNVLESRGKVFGTKLTGLKGILGIKFAENKRFGTELSYYAKMNGVGGIIHSDEDLSKYNFNENEINELKSKLNIKDSDAFVIVAAEENKAKKAILSVIARAIKQYTGAFPQEVRKAEEDITTSFLRPMPGAARMYVETDLPLILITKERLNKIKLPELISNKIENLEEIYNLQPELAREIIKKEIDFEHFISQYRNIDANTIARILIEIPKEIKSRLNLDSSKLLETDFHNILQLLDENKIPKNSVIDILSDIIRFGKVDLNKYKLVSEKELELEIKKIIDSNKSASFSALMGEAMKKFKGKADPKKVSELINKYV